MLNEMKLYLIMSLESEFFSKNNDLILKYYSINNFKK